MDINLILVGSLVFVIAIVITFYVTKWRFNKGLKEYRTLSEAISKSQDALSLINSSLTESQNLLTKTDNETKELQSLKDNADKLESEVKLNASKLVSLNTDIRDKTNEATERSQELHDLIAKLDLYTRIDQFVDHGHFEMPEYLYDTSERFSEEIKRIRKKQQELIKDKKAVVYPSSTVVSNDKSYNKKILDGQVKLMLTSFNIECDALIGKVSPSSFPRTLERIEKLANTLEKSAATLNCGFDLKYVEYKYEECRLQYQYSLKKQEEKDEQRLIREQIREEQKAIKEYEKAIAQAEQEEKMYRDMLDKARQELSKVSEEDRIIAEQRIAELEHKLLDAEAKETRAKSMAEQTRKGHVYIISNIGSFGEDVYKIGLTRRLEPMDRVKELGDASVPFTFDVHAMIYVEDAPALESALHREFTGSRVNSVNLRKEFFRTKLHDIKEAVERIAGVEADFKTTIAAEEYYESRRLQGIVSTA
ncbi:MAG: DUF4041 domain-containing protein [Methylococcales bacterium]